MKLINIPTFPPIVIPNTNKKVIIVPVVTFSLSLIVFSCGANIIIQLEQYPLVNEKNIIIIIATISFLKIGGLTQNINNGKKIILDKFKIITIIFGKTINLGKSLPMKSNKLTKINY
jgi:hypothetical protein